MYTNWLIGAIGASTDFEFCEDFAEPEKMFGVVLLAQLDEDILGCFEQKH